MTLQVNKLDLYALHKCAMVLVCRQGWELRVLFRGGCIEGFLNWGLYWGPERQRDRLHAAANGWARPLEGFLPQGLHAPVLCVVPIAQRPPATLQDCQPMKMQGRVRVDVWFRA